MKFNITLGYTSKLTPRETIDGIQDIKESLKNKIKTNFELTEVDTGIVTDKNIWLNDDFQYQQRPIDFDISSEKVYGELIQANNKWRRYFLYNNEFINPGEGIITTFKSVQRDAKVDNTNSIVFEELGCEIIATKNEHEIEKTAIALYEAVKQVDKEISQQYPQLNQSHFSDTLTFITYKQLRGIYPFLSFKERINMFAKENGSFVLHNYVTKLFNQKDASNYSEDVFDFTSYSKLYVYNRSSEKAMSIGYISYQVDREVLKEQNLILKENWKNNTVYNYLIKTNELPSTVSAGLFQARIVMAILEKQHIAEVQSSVWDQEFIDYCKTNNINIL